MSLVIQNAAMAVLGILVGRSDDNRLLELKSSFRNFNRENIFLNVFPIFLCVNLFQLLFPLLFKNFYAILEIESEVIR